MKQDAASVSGPPRLLGAGTALERQLLQSVCWDAAPAGARERMAAALGPVLVDTPALQVAHEPTRAEWLRAACRPRAALLGLVGAGIALYLVASLLSRPAETSPHSQLAPVPAEQPVSAGVPATLQARPDFAEGASVLPPSAPQRQHRAPSVKLAATRAVAPSIPASASTGSLLEEVRLLDAIRAKLRAGQLEAASRALGQYDQRFPRGELRLEKSILALDLLMDTGQQVPARARARELLLQPGMQRYAAHLRAIADSSALVTSGNGSDPGDAHIRGRR